MTELTVYVDPACPWAWRTALWVRAVRQMRPLRVQWRLFSLTEVHRGEDPLAVEKFGAFGVPWLVLEGQSFGLFGPVISEVPQGEAALQLWEHVSWLLAQPYFFELKRARA